MRLPTTETLADLFPRSIFRVAYDLLHEAHPATAERQYVRLLELAARESEEVVAEALRTLVIGGEAVTPERIANMTAARTSLTPPPSKAVRVAPVVLAAYDTLLGTYGGEVRS